jgi:hypothetical protein
MVPQIPYSAIGIGIAVICIIYPRFHGMEVR